MSSVIDGSFESGWCQQPDLTGELSMTTAKPIARYGAVEGALASGFATAELHHLWDATIDPADPAADVRIEHPRQIIESLVTAKAQRPTTDSVSP
ncbi:hypothetical protein X747_31870 [Mesorhizobium sp. LNJC384A00]|uniref:hypothetical protein n=1 Tax=Mesorhizobium sp. LNJC384A00 TaxID=1287268 RepID=UPI0003CE200F|nr:hypothetical protein [Mesorhizobium sp. LNJC384A00]ESY30745.1 hypothetical protein X747_31870 [Mesorhizobium sp. LNJC384A00]